MEQILVCLSVALVLGLLATRIANLVNLPAVTAYLITGLILGPYLLGALNLPGIGFATMESVQSFGILNQTALGFIAFAIGNEFRMQDLKSMGRQAITVGILQAVITTVIVDIVLCGLHFAIPSVLSLSSAITLGSIAAATAPAATLMVVRQYKAEGPLTKLLLMVVAIDDAVGLVLFAVSFGVACALESGTVNLITVALEPVLEIIDSLVLGCVAGLLLNLVEIKFHSHSKRRSIALGFVLVTIGLSMTDIELWGIRFNFSLLLVCMIMGTVFCNICSASEELMMRVDHWTAPLNVLFFVLSGAELDLKVIGSPLVLLIGILYIIGRSAGKISGAYISCTMTGCSKKIRSNLGITLLPQAGVALGMAETAGLLSDGAIVRNVVLFSVLVYELVGPTLTRISLIRAGEIKVEERQHHRFVNKPRPGETVT